MKLIDDRTEKEKVTHQWIIAATDRFMSGWGEARNGTSYAGWACEHKDIQKVETWVRSRSEMKRVRLVFGTWKPKGIGHTHIYVVREGHPALN